MLSRMKPPTFLVRNIGDGINARGVSAHGFAEVVVVDILDSAKQIRWHQEKHEYDRGPVGGL